jgi:sec-independent protein translocase protein TatB
MFDITSSKLFLLAIVALLVIGPKDFPLLLRTIGKYMGIIRGHARDFRAQFDEAMRESELTQLKQDMEKMAQETEASLNATGRSVEQTLDEARQSVESSVDGAVTNPLAPAGDPAPAADPAPQMGGPGPQPSDAETPVSADPAPAESASPVAPQSEPATTIAATPAASPAPAAQPAVERSGA